MEGDLTSAFSYLNRTRADNPFNKAAKEVENVRSMDMDMDDKNKHIVDKMLHALNGPTRPAMPQMTPFMVEDAENEIRRSVQRHYEMQATIETLKTDIEHWKHRATVAETELERMKEKLDDKEHRIDELKNGVATLRAQFETGAQIWLNGYRQLQDLGHVKLVTPPALLEALEHKETESDQ